MSVDCYVQAPSTPVPMQYGERLMDSTDAANVAIETTEAATAVHGPSSITAMNAPNSPISMNSGHQSPPVHLPNGLSRQASPATSTISSLSTSKSITPPPASNSATLHIPTSSSVLPPPAKRRKLTPSERERKRLEKEEKDRQREESKAQREEEKRQKDEERRQKNEEKEEKRREREIEKQKKEEEKSQKEQAKEEEKKKKEEEKEKRERAQSRINAFFAKPTTPAKPASATLHVGSTEQTTVAASPLTFDTIVSDVKASQPEKSDYERTFLPYSLPLNTVCAPENAFTWDSDAVAHVERAIEHAFETSSENCNEPNSILQNSFDSATNRYLWNYGPDSELNLSMKDAMTKLSGSESNPIDLTPKASQQSSVNLLNRIAMKYIFFHQDIRPPYIGTYTKIQSKSEARKICRNPFRKSRPDTNYEEDSEAEWEEPEEGEDLNSEGKSEADSLDDEEEMAGFLDDEDAADVPKPKKKALSDMEPISSGMCWEDARGEIKYALNGQISSLDEYKMEVIHADHRLPLDPFTTSYWSIGPGMTSQTESSNKGSSADQARMPLQSKPNITINGVVAPPNPENAAQHLMKKAAKPTNASAKVLSGEDLEAFKKVVEGNELNKVGLLAVLKKRFPKTTNTVLKDTLGVMAARVGRNEAEKRWTVVEQQTKAASENAER